jgi:purine catabolism regulator
MLDEGNGWLITRLGHRDRRWGRLILQSPTPPPQRLFALVERAAAALALHRLHDRDRDNFVRRTHHELLLALQNEPLSPDVVRRCDLAGFPVAHRQFVGITMRPTGAEQEACTARRSSSEEALSAVVQACNQRDVPALIAAIDNDIRVLLSINTRVSAYALTEQLASQVSRHRSVIIGAGRTATTPETISRTLREAQQVVDSVRPGDELEPARSFFRLLDVHIRGLLTLWGEDDRLQLFVSRELEALKAHDEEHQSNLMETLRALLEHESKADAASRLHLSRAAFYSRLARIESTLGVRLDDVEIRTSLHVALIADDLAAQRERNGASRGNREGKTA